MDQQPRKAEPESKPAGQDPQQNSSTTPDLKGGDSNRNGSPNRESLLMGSESHAAQSQSDEGANRIGSARKSVHWSPELVTGQTYASNDNNGNVYHDGSNPYVSSSPALSSSSSFSIKETMGTVKDMFGKWRKKVGEASRKAEDLAGNTWQHLKTAPSFADAALGRIAQGTKVLAEGGYENIFRQTFETVPEEHLLNSFACYLSTSAGPVMGILYVSTAKLAYCSDNPLSYKSDRGETEWSYYKVVIPLHQLKAVNPSASRTNPAEKYIQLVSVDNHEFWFMGFFGYDGAVKVLQDSLQANELRSV